MLKALTTALKLFDLALIQVGPRDGLQAVKAIVPTPIKIEFIRKLLAAQGANHGEVEFTSSVSPKAVPQLGDCREVSEAFPDKGRGSILVLNSKGAQTALDLGYTRLSTVASPSKHLPQKIWVQLKSRWIKGWQRCGSSH